MAKQINDVVPGTGSEIRSKKWSRIKSFVSRILGRVDKQFDSSALSVEPPVEPDDKSAAPAITAESHEFVGEIRTENSTAPVAEAQAESFEPETSDHQVVQATVVDGSQVEARDHHDVTPASKKTPRDLWAEAWNSPTLTADEKAHLEERWENTDSVRQSLEESRGDAIAERGKSSEDGRKETNIVDQPAYVQRVIEGVEEVKKRHEDWWGTPDAPSRAGKVLDAVVIFKELGDVAFKFDPSGYASSAWTVVSIGLDLVATDKQNRDTAFTATTYLAELLTRYHRIESYYRLADIADAGLDDLLNAIVQGYVAILKYSAVVKHAATASLRSRITAAFTVTGDIYKSLQDKITSSDATVARWQGIVNSELSRLFRERTNRSLDDVKRSHAEMHRGLYNVQEGVAAVQQGLEVLQETSILDRLCDSTTHSVEHQRLADEIGRLEFRTPGDWFIHKRDEYTDWKNTPSSVVWLHAPSGCGKSWLCHSIIEDLRQICAPQNPQKLLLYWYFKDAKDSTLVYRSFLRQLADALDHTFPKTIHKWLTSLSVSLGGMNWAEQLGAWFDALNRQIYIVLDGIDELPQGQLKPVGRRQDALKLVSTLVEKRQPYLHILLLSRDEHDIRSCLHPSEDVKEIDIGHALKDDLDNFITEAMQKDPRVQGLDTELKKKITDRLTNSDDRNFLWANSLLDDLRECEGDDEILEKLEKVPEMMAEKYKESLDRIARGDKQDKLRMKKILMWLFYKKRKEPLTVEEIASGAGSRISVSDLKKLLGVVRALMKISPLDGSLRKSAGHDDESGDNRVTQSPLRHVVFVHSSAKEYLEEQLWPGSRKAALAGEMPAPNAQALHWLSFTGEEAHHEITKRCLQVLMTGSITSSKESRGDGRSDKSALKRYAAQHWHEHYLEIAKHHELPKTTDAAADTLEHRPISKDVSDIEDSIKKLLNPDERFYKSWLESYNPDDDPSLPKCKLDRDGQGSDWCIDSDSDSDSDNYGGSDDDIDNKSEVTTRSELESVGSTGGDNDGDSSNGNDESRKPLPDPVYFALKLGLLKVANEMIEKKPLSACEHPGNEGTVLQLALCHELWDVVDNLLESRNYSKMDITVRHGHHGTPLYIASALGNKDIVSKLIDRGARAHGTKEGKYGSAIHAAAYYGHEPILEHLLGQKEVHVDQRGGVFGTALQAAAAQGHEDIVQLLLGYGSGADPTITGGLYGTALQAAWARLPEFNNQTLETLQRAVDVRGLDSSNHSRIGWKSGFDQLQRTSPTILNQYTSLFLSTESPFLMNDQGLQTRQRVLITVRKDWVLPAASDLRECVMLATQFLYQVPVQEQLEDIQRVLPSFSNQSPSDELIKVDFLYKALFWSGINYILKQLRPWIRLLMETADVIVQPMLAHLNDHRSMRREYRWRRHLRRPAFDSSMNKWVQEMWWGQLAPHRELEYRHDLVSPYEMDFAQRSFRNVDMDISDRLVLQLSRQRQRIHAQFSHRDQAASMTAALGKSRGVSNLSPRSYGSDDRRSLDSENGSDDNSNASGVGDDGEGPSKADIYGLMGGLLPLLKDIVEFGNQCDRFHRAEARRQDAETIKRLTFETFAAVARLSLAFKDSSPESFNTDIHSLAETVGLLRTVRLARMTKLSETMTLNELPRLVREDMRPLFNVVRDEIREKISKSGAEDICNEVCKRMGEFVPKAVRDELEHQAEATEVTHDAVEEDGRPTTGNFFSSLRW